MEEGSRRPGWEFNFRPGASQISPGELVFRLPRARNIFAEIRNFPPDGAIISPAMITVGHPLVRVAR